MRESGTLFGMMRGSSPLKERREDGQTHGKVGDFDDESIWKFPSCCFSVKEEEYWGLKRMHGTA